LLALASCSDNSADRDGNGIIDEEERSAEMDYDAFIPMKALARQGAETADYG
jgi:hypothetical protein